MGTRELPLRACPESHLAKPRWAEGGGTGSRCVPVFIKHNWLPWETWLLLFLESCPDTGCYQSGPAASRILKSNIKLWTSEMKGNPLLAHLWAGPSRESTFSSAWSTVETRFLFRNAPCAECWEGPGVREGGPSQHGIVITECTWLLMPGPLIVTVSGSWEGGRHYQVRIPQVS